MLNFFGEFIFRGAHKIDFWGNFELQKLPTSEKNEKQGGWGVPMRWPNLSLIGLEFDLWGQRNWVYNPPNLDFRGIVEFCGPPPHTYPARSGISLQFTNLHQGLNQQWKFGWPSFPSSGDIGPQYLAWSRNGEMDFRRVFHFRGPFPLTYPKG